MTFAVMQRASISKSNVFSLSHRGHLGIYSLKASIKPQPHPCELFEIGMISVLGMVNLWETSSNLAALFMIQHMHA